MTIDSFVQILLAVIGCFGTYILYGMKDEMKSTREELTSLAQSVAVMVAKSDWHEKRLDKHDEEIEELKK